jgi:hypothetical protein
MPVTAKFSEEFYERLGHRVADELVDWFNQVDATYRSEFRDLFDTRFAHLEAKLDQRFAELDRRFAEQDTRWERRFGELRAEVAAQKAELIKWMFGFWAPTAVGVIALLLK